MTTAAITEVNQPATRTAVQQRRAAAPYMNPYLAGVGLGLVLLIAFITMGHGLGASGAVVSNTFDPPPADRANTSEGPIAKNASMTGAALRFR